MEPLKMVEKIHIVYSIWYYYAALQRKFTFNAMSSPRKPKKATNSSFQFFNFGKLLHKMHDESRASTSNGLKLCHNYRLIYDYGRPTDRCSEIDYEFNFFLKKKKILKAMREAQLYYTARLTFNLVYLRATAYVDV